MSSESSLLRPGQGFAPFFAGLRTASRRALLLDYDGTLAPFAARRSAAAPYRWARAAIRSIAAAARPTRIGIVSGRPVAELRRLTGLANVAELWGSHGLERLTLEGCWIGPPPKKDAVEFLERVAASMTELGWGALLERKPYGLALHGRGAPPEEFADAEAELIDRWSDAAHEFGLELLGFDCGVELRPEGQGKGMVVRTILDELGSGASIAYLGDDRTDEDAFGALADRGLAVLVRDEPRPTKAAAWIRPPEELRRFLGEWNRACSGESA